HLSNILRRKLLELEPFGINGLMSATSLRSDGN
ncbi:MAG: hypothetical protein ACI83D_000738, partial [Planctomycetota bacterium]